LAFHYVLR